MLPVVSQQTAVTYQGKTLLPAEWAEELGISLNAMVLRLRRHPVELAMVHGRPQRRVTLANEVNDVDPYDRDKVCQDYVSKHPDGMNEEQIATAMGLTRQRVNQLVRIAQDKARYAALIVEALGERHGERVLTKLRGRSVRHYQRALEAARSRGYV